MLCSKKYLILTYFAKKGNFHREFSVLEDVSRRLCGTDESKYCEFIRLLLEHGAKVKEPLSYNHPVKYALCFNWQCSKVIDLYMSYGYRRRESLLHCAIVQQKEHCCRTLIEWGAYIANPKKDPSLQMGFISSEPKVPTYFCFAKHYFFIRLMCILNNRHQSSVFTRRVGAGLVCRKPKKEFVRVEKVSNAYVYAMGVHNAVQNAEASCIITATV